MNKQTTTKWMAVAALALGATTLIPAATASADDWRRDDRYGNRYDRYERNDRWERDRVRYERRDNCGPDFDVLVNMRDVPHRVLRTLESETRGRRVEAVYHVRRDGHEFFRFRVDRGERNDANVRIAPDGGLLGIESAHADFPRGTVPAPHDRRW